MNACWLFHKWGKWEDKDVIRIAGEDNKVKFRGIIQHRRCERCGMLQARAQKEADVFL